MKDSTIWHTHTIQIMDNNAYSIFWFNMNICEKSFHVSCSSTKYNAPRVLFSHFTLQEQQTYLHKEVDNSQGCYDDHKDGNVVDDDKNGTGQRNDSLKHTSQLIR